MNTPTTEAGLEGREQMLALIEKHLGLKPYRKDCVINNGTGRWTDAARYYDLMNAWADAREAATRAEMETLKQERDQHLRLRLEFADIIANHIIAMQAAVIAYELEGPEDGIAWIQNTLCGPGFLPDIDSARTSGGAQAWFDAKMAEHEAFRAANPGPARSGLAATSVAKG